MAKRGKNNDNWNIAIGLGSLAVGIIGLGIAANEASKPRCTVCNQKLEVKFIEEHNYHYCKKCYSYTRID